MPDRLWNRLAFVLEDEGEIYLIYPARLVAFIRSGGSAGF